MNTYTYHPDHHFKIPSPTTLLETIETIRQLRLDADQEERGDSYDPCGHTRARANAMRELADTLERTMETRLGWNTLPNHTAWSLTYKRIGGIGCAVFCHNGVETFTWEIEKNVGESYDHIPTGCPKAWNMLAKLNGLIP